MSAQLDDRRRRVELAAASYRLLTAGVGAGPSALLTRDELAAALEGPVATANRDELAATLTRLGLGACLRVAVEGEGKSRSADTERLARWLQNAPALAAADSLYVAARAKAGFDDAELCRALVEESRFRELGRCAALLPERTRVSVIPSAAMLAAPLGKVGFFASAVQDPELIMLFGCSAEMHARTRLDWPQWLRLGVWHMAARRYWEAAMASQAVSPERDAEWLALLPPRFRLKVGIHEASVGSHSSFRSYFLDHLVSACKVIAEEGVGGPRAAFEQLSWLTSLGRFHLPWFHRRLLESPIDESSLKNLLAAWRNDVGGLVAQDPQFAGPLGAAENAIWNHQSRVVCSPSVDKKTKRLLALWFKNYWPVEVTFVEAAPSAALDPEWQASCNLVFGLWSDREWLAERVPAFELELPNGRHVTADNPDHWALTYVTNNPLAPSRFTRVCLAPDADALLSMHRGIRHFSDWTARRGPETISGRSQVAADGKLRLATPAASNIAGSESKGSTE